MLILSGYAISWNVLSNKIDKKDDPFYMQVNEPYYEKINKNAFTTSLNQNNQVALIEHDSSQEIGRCDSFNLIFQEDDLGLRFQLKLKEDTLGTATFFKVLNKELSKVSISFYPLEYKYEKLNRNIRTIYKADLVEISLTNNPLYLDTSVTIGKEKEFLLGKIDKLISLM
ncbi:HK97 family phage prohead protease [Lactococcus lactis]|uniref:HK97 family phage prohead protease n=1 Tax=Lactococcus lactis TaxID=1358 RepID=UPI000BA709CE|nr:HK97 family phage prohead protease [Lactococcus lactis]PAK67802.1 peptidase [Lactococcus lactis]PEN17734.1 HK97 family phage prohead protease [Lactococcus lactis]TYR17215.1 HK97 family phage prohead protease [Lactococcus lactis subsp. lactis bv. diacetylactis]